MKPKYFIGLLAAGLAAVSVMTVGCVGNRMQRPALTGYEEAPDPHPADSAAWAGVEGVRVGFADVDTRYPLGGPLPRLEAEWHGDAWRGERIHTQLLVGTAVRIDDVRVDAGALKGPQGRIPASAVQVGRVRYVLSDRLNAEGFGYGITPELHAEASLSADAIDPETGGAVEAHTLRPFWLTVEVPHTAPAGTYTGCVTVRADGERFRLPFSVRVSERTLPEPAQRRFYLDLWQNPFSVARYHGVEPWSEAHFAAMKPYMELLARAGQRAVTVSMIHDPWRGQTHDIYRSMIRWVKHADGSWSYDYDIFDRWVGFMERLGIDRTINCYTMVPWNNRFYYYDEAAGCDTVLVAKTGTPEFEAHWRPMLRDFARHLRATGRFDRTAIAMDERPLEDMLSVIRLVRSVDPEFRISLAGSYHEELAHEIYDYCIAWNETWPDEVREARLSAGLPTTFYTCCIEGHPNTFTFSPSAEAAWMGWYAAAKGLSGYLRWAYNCWPEDALRDARFGTWSSGDTFLVYPGPRSSIRFERLVEGIQAYEKVLVLQEEFRRDGRTREADALREMLEEFDAAALADSGAAAIIARANNRIRNF